MCVPSRRTGLVSCVTTCVCTGVDMISAADIRFCSADAYFCVKVLLCGCGCGCVRLRVRLCVCVYLLLCVCVCVYLLLCVCVCV